MSFVPAVAGLVSTGNSSSAVLNGGATFTGTAEDVTNYASITVNVYASHASAANGLQFQSSTDNSNWNTFQQETLVAATNEIHFPMKTAKWFRIVYTNGGTLQTSFRLQTVYHGSSNPLPIVHLQDTLSSTTQDAVITRSILCGQTMSSGVMQNITTSAEGHLEVAAVEPTTAFGELLSAEPTPVTQIDFVYGLNTNNTISTSSGTGSATATNGLLTLSTGGTAVGAAASLTSKRYLKYRAGQGGRARFTAAFTTVIPSTLQLAGLGDSENGYFFTGYYSAGPQFGIMRRSKASGSIVDTYVKQTDWNVDVCDGSSSVSNKSGFLLDYTKGNVFQVTTTYLGFGNINFFIMNAASGQFIRVHSIQYPNSVTQQLVANPSMPLLWSVLNTGGPAAVGTITLKAASGALLVDGRHRVFGSKYAASNNKATISTRTNIFSLQNVTTFNTIANKAQVVLRSISFNSSDNGTNWALLEIVRNTTLGGTPAWTGRDGTVVDGTTGIAVTSAQSCVTIDTAGTTVTGGTVIYNAAASNNGGTTENVFDLDLIIFPGDKLSFAVTCSASATVIVACNWTEDI